MNCFLKPQTTNAHRRRPLSQPMRMSCLRPITDPCLPFDLRVRLTIAPHTPFVVTCRSLTSSVPQSHPLPRHRPNRPLSPSPIASFAASVNVGNTEAQTSAQASGLSQNCSIVANANTSDNGLGQQQVCIYTQGDKIVTVTYLNGQVISASKSGF